MYDFKCLKCNNEFEDYAKIDDREDVLCPKCQGFTQVLITQGKAKDWFHPHYNEGLEEFVTSKKHYKQLCLKHNVTSRALGDVRNYYHLHEGERGY